MFNHGISSRLILLQNLLKAVGHWKKTHKGSSWVFEGEIPKKLVPALI